MIMAVLGRLSLFGFTLLISLLFVEFGSRFLFPQWAPVRGIGHTSWVSAQRPSMGVMPEPSLYVLSPARSAIFNFCWVFECGDRINVEELICERKSCFRFDGHLSELNWKA